MITPYSRSQGNWSLFRAIIITIIRMMMRAFIFLESNNLLPIAQCKKDAAAGAKATKTSSSSTKPSLKR